MTFCVSIWKDPSERAAVSDFESKILGGECVLVVVLRVANVGLSKYASTHTHPCPLALKDTQLRSGEMTTKLAFPPR